MKKLLYVVLAVLLFVPACGKDTPSTPTPPPMPPPAPVTVSSLALFGPESFIVSRTLEVGQTAQMSVDVTYSNGDVDETLDGATWTSSNDHVATVNSRGLVTARNPGGFNISASYRGVSIRSGDFRSERPSTPLPPAPTPPPSATVVDLSIRSDDGFTGNPVLDVGDTTQLLLRAEYSNGMTSFVTSSAIWRSSNNSVGTVSSSGLVRGRSEGSFSITASFGGQSESLDGIRVEEEDTPTPPPTPAPASPPVRRYDNCQAMWDAGWDLGVNRNGGTYRHRHGTAWDDNEKRTYAAQSSQRDRDNDGHACERDS